MAPKTPKSPVTDKPEGSLQAPQVPPAEPAAAAASQAAPGKDVTGADADPLPPQVAGIVRIRALRVIEHNGVRYGPEEHAGDELEVSDAQFHLLNPIQAAERL